MKEKRVQYMGGLRRIVAFMLCMFVMVSSLPLNVYGNENVVNQQEEREAIERGENSAIAPSGLDEKEEVVYDDLVSTFSLLDENEYKQAEVLLIKNKNPWNSYANETVLLDLEISYETVTVEKAKDLDFDNYKLVIVANDQVDSFYRSLSLIRTKLELFVMNGGTLLYGICDAGWGSGYSDLLIPGDVRLAQVSFQDYNYIVDETHPVVTGVLTGESALINSQLYNHYASHRYFEMDSLPADTNIVLEAGRNMPTLIEYSIGNGIVIASGLTWEHSYDHSSTDFGKQKFDDLILYAYTMSRAVTEINKTPNLGFEEYVNGLTCTAGDPVNVSNGNFVTGNVDLSYEGDISINFSRYYNSMDSYQGELGHNWRSNYNIILQQLSERRLRLWHEDGYSEDFIFGDDGIWYTTPGTYSKINVSEADITITLKDKTVYRFDMDCKILSIKQPYDLEITFEYNSDNQVAVVRQGEFWLEYIYEGSLLTAIKDKSGRTVKFHYTGANLTCVERYDGKITKYEYDASGRMTKIYMDEEYTIQNVYDEFGRVVEQEMSGEGKCQFVYDDKTQTTKYIDKNGAVTVYCKDDQGRIYKKDYVDGSELLEFDNNDRIIKKTDKLGNSVCYEYDSNGNCISEIDAVGNKITYEFDEQGNRIAMTDAEDNHYEYIYDTDNYLIGQSDAYGQFTRFEYDEKKQLVKVILPNQKEASFSYDAYGNVISCTDSDGNQTCYTYNDMNQLVQEIDANKNVITYEYSNFGRTQKTIYEDGSFNVSEYDTNEKLIAYTDELGNQQSCEYNSMGLLTMFKDNLGNIIKYEYDCMNNVNKIINADGSERHYHYDLSGNLIQIIDEEGCTTHYKYDSNGNIIEETDGNGNVTYYTYDALNRIITVTDGNGNRTTNEYSPNGYLLSVTNTNGNSEKFVYNNNGQVISWINEAGEEEKYEYDVMGYASSATDANGNTVKYEYNGSGNITKIIYADSSFISIGYDKKGNMVSFIEPNGAETKYTYNCKGLLLSEQFADRAKREYSYDAVGNQISSMDENGNVTNYEYDDLYRLAKVIDALGNVTEYEYDVRNNLTEVIQYSQVPTSVIKSMKSKKGTTYDNSVTEIVTKYSYDKKNQLVKEVSPTEQVISYQYDSNGNVVCKVDEDKISTRYEYDAVNNIVGVQYGDGKSVQYQYNENGYVVSMTDWNGTTNYELDEVGRVLGISDYEGKNIKYQWNANGEKSLIVYPDNSTVAYEYDSKNQLIKVDDSVMGSTSYEYDVNGNMIKVIMSNGTVTTNVYDKMSRITQKTDYDKNNKIVDNYTYSYDKVGNKIKVNRDKKLSLSEKVVDESNGTTIYEYDTLNRLSSQTNSRGIKEKYFYDSLGNRIRKETWSKRGVFLTVCDYAYNAEKQLESIKGNSETVYGTIAVEPVKMEYDGRGNLVRVSQNKMELASFVYDETNTMTQSKNQLGLITKYVYDGNGARIEKTTSLPDDFEKFSSKVKKRLYTALEPLCDVDVKNIDTNISNYYINDITSDYNSVLFSYGNYSQKVRYTYGLDILGATSCDSGVIDWSNDTETAIDYDNKNNVYFFLDEQGTPIKLTNQSGKVVQKYSYDEYGVPGTGTYISDFIGKNSIIGYAGYQYDYETGLYFVQARYYNPNTVGFVSRDAFEGMISEPQSLNRYMYCYGNPITYVDPSGYYTIQEGNAVHVMLQQIFMLYYAHIPGVTPYVEYPVHGVVGNISGKGRADMVLDNGIVKEVYEIKPITYKKNPLGSQQLQGYVNALNANGAVAVKGGPFSAVATKLSRMPYPFDKSRYVKFYTFPNDPGMIYYAINNYPKKPCPAPAPEPVSESKKTSLKVTTQNACEGVLIAGGTVAVGYVIYRAIRLLPSLTPVTWWTLPANLACP